MTDFNRPVMETKQIIISFLAALLLGAVIFVVAVLPAEYGLDPIGTGKLFGFDKLYQADTSSAKTSEATPVQKRILKLENAGSKPEIKRPKEADYPAPSKQYDERKDEISITIPAGKGLEFKVYLLKYGTMKYEWITDEGVLFFDFHGEVNEAKPVQPVFYQSHTVAYSNNMIGTFLAPFEGRHGWYFKNSDSKDKLVKLRLKGEYRLVD